MTKSLAVGVVVMPPFVISDCKGRAALIMSKAAPPQPKPLLRENQGEIGRLRFRLNQHFDQSEKFLPFFLEKMQGYIV